MTKLLVITGPTNVGKTALAVNLTDQLNGEIISADSRQIYREMNIGTAKPNLAEQQQAHHHLIDIVNPDQSFTLADFQHHAYQAIDDIISRGKNPILVGGTGLYISALVNGLKIPRVAPDGELRAQLEALPAQDLLQKLQKLDPISAKTIPPQNKRRLIRALEVTTILGRPFSEVNKDYHHPFDTLKISLTAPRQTLYDRADRGVDEWLKSGWLEEVRSLRAKYAATLPSMSSIGYREIGMFLDGQISLDEAIRRVKFARHAYIRRQLTWLRRDPDIQWFDTTADDWQKQVEKLALSWYAEDV